MKATVLTTLLFLLTSTLFGQDIKIGFKDSIQSNVLNETPDAHS